MTFAAYKDTPGRQPATLLELDLDFCSRRYGVSPCAATLALKNNLNYSEQFDVATAGPTPGWAGTSFTTANAANSPFGDATADEIARTVTSAITLQTYQDRDIGLSTIPNNTAMAVSFHVLPKLVGGVVSEPYVQVEFMSSGTPVAWARFDIEKGIFLGYGGSGSGAEGLGGKIRYVHEGTEAGYYRLTLYFDSGAVPGTPQVGITAVDSAGTRSTTGAIGDGFYLWGASEIQLSATGQLLTGTYDGPFYPGYYAVRTTAVIGDADGVPNDLCYNTFGTCQDTANYLKEVRTLQFINTITRPVSFSNYYPAIMGVRYTPTVLNPGGNLSVRGSVTITLQDFATTDNEIDDYVHERTYDPEDLGTFFGKLKARQKYYIGRPMRVLEGYIDGSSTTDFRTREYIIDDISGPTADGQVTITGKDVLAKAADVRAKAPQASTGTLAAGITSGQTTATLATGTGSQYSNGDHIRINDEIILINTILVDSITSMSRSQGGTTAAAHNSGDAVQLCLTYTDEPIIDVVNDLLQNYAGISSSFIPYTDWEAEETESLSGYLMTTIISEPTGVLTLLKELVEITLLDIWYDDTDQEIKLKLQTPFTSVTEELTDSLDILEDSLRVKDLNNERLTRVLIYYGIRNYAKDLGKTENYSLIQFDIDADKEGTNKYGDERIKVIKSRWFDSSNSTQVALTAQRLLDRFGITPKEIEFALDAKDAERVVTGDVLDITSRIEQDVDGMPATQRYQITEVKPYLPGSQYKYTALAFFQDPTPDSLTISTNQIDYNVFVELGGPPGPVDVTLTINSSITVDGSNGNPAITTEGMHPDSTLTIINNGSIRGYGGNGGIGNPLNISSVYEPEPPGFCDYFGSAPSGVPGQDGGDAIYATCDVIIDNTSGNIWAGAGGGGSGGSDARNATPGGGGGGGGGLGTDTGGGGIGGVVTVLVESGSCPIAEVNGTAGTGGTTSAGGTGGTGGNGAGDGGDGGTDWGEDGQAGTGGVGSPNTNGGAGGAGGYAVRLNGNGITWEGGNNSTQVKGDVA